ncbi:Zinc-finger domain of monoamine-oxidase A repressor R1 protein [Prunus dulcis]|uniref:Zinc-finger domain of monoamine-oxidase A repressor R1 protein n=1 Tax=Prunus dulcis TaxID=3755 RepID=A0A4Y1R854_PRUDU|nr:Zinc-finger domain of monoamine-oxidase A repressor R1 protein [Prunus dulcis]
MVRVSIRVEIQRKREVEREREMASSSSSLAQKNESERVRDDMVGQVKNRVHGGRAKGKTCHQCRQKTLNFAASCTNIKTKGRRCQINVCCRCLLNRNKKGLQPTGLLAPTAKAEGFKSVFEMLSVKGLENLGRDKNAGRKGASRKKAVALDEDPVVDSPRKRGKENSVEGSDDVNLNETLDSDELKSKKAKRGRLMEIGNEGRDDAKAKTGRGRRRGKECSMKKNKAEEGEDDAVLPQGKPVTDAAQIEIPPEDAGNALQFLEFFSAFGEVLDFERDQAEHLLKELLHRGRGRSGRPEQYSSIIRFHIMMLSFIQEDTGKESHCIGETSNKNTWFQDLGKRISKSGISGNVMDGLPPECFSKGSAGYEMLNFSQRLRLLTFLCDEALGTNTLRDWIDMQSEESVETKNAKGKVAAAKDKEKEIQKRLEVEKAKRVNAEKDGPVSIEKHDTNTMVSRLESEVAQAQAEVAEAAAMVPKKKPFSDAMRTQPHLVDADGRVFWKLNSHTGGEGGVLLQDMGKWDASPSHEKWFVYGAEAKRGQQKEKRAMRKKRSKTSCESNEEIMELIPESNEENIELSPESNEENKELSLKVLK